jgi:hypothetical protein
MKFKKGDKVKLKSIESIKNILDLMGLEYINYGNGIRAGDDIYIVDNMIGKGHFKIDDTGGCEYDHSGDNGFMYCDWMLEWA